MPNSPSGDSPDFHRAYALFQRALALPPAEREAFVRHEAGEDRALCSTVLKLLAHGEVATEDITERLAEQIAEAQDAADDDTHDSGERHVRSTAAGDVLAQIQATPLLDDPRYRRGEQIGLGGMGEISFVHDRRLNRGLAIKALLSRRYAPPLDEESRQLQEQDAAQRLARFLEEAQVTSQLEHPGVVPVHEVGRDSDGKLCFTMRRIKGNTVSTIFRMARAGEDDWTRTRALEVALKICDTVAFAHAKGVLHRDLKPENVMVGRFGEVYVMDWGLAKVRGQRDLHDLRIRKDATPPISHVNALRGLNAESADDRALRTMDGTTLGTPNYMPPEQGLGVPLDERADVYAIGAMLYELLTGRAPYKLPGVLQTAEHVLADLLAGPPRRIEDLEKGVAPELVAIVDKAMQRDRELRYPDTTVLAAELRAFLDQRVVKAYRTGALVEMKLWVRRNRPLAASLAAAVLILVAGITLALHLAASEATAKLKAQEEQQRAERNEQLAKDQAAELKIENDKNRIFAEVALLAEARRAEEGLYPAFPDKVPAMKAWLKELGEPLAARLPSWEEELTKLRRKAKPLSDEQRQAARDSHASWPELRQLRAELEMTSTKSRRIDIMEQIATLDTEIEVAAAEFADPKDAYVHHTLTRLVRELRDFATGRLPAVREQLGTAETVKQKSIDAQRAAWYSAIAAIQASDGVRASKLYAGLELTPQIGLVPLGMDQRSRLWEFKHVTSADPSAVTPAPGPDGLLPQPMDGQGLVFVLLPGGKLPLLDGAEPEHYHLVRLEPFFLSKYEMTRAQWERLNGRPAPLSSDPSRCQPAKDVSWFDAERICRKFGLALPSELQWEYACRAGTTTLFWTGSDEQSIREHELLGMPWGFQLPRVGSRFANPFGFFDMGGSLREWCSDQPEPGRIGGDLFDERPGDGRRPELVSWGSPRRVVRGGCYLDPLFWGKSGSTDSCYPAQHGLIGVRPARTVQP